MLLFVTGTDTEIGKTYIAASLARRLRDEGKRVGVYKPVASGCVVDASGELVSEDALALWEAAGRPETLDRVCPQRFKAPLAPPAAAAAEGRVVDREQMIAAARWWIPRCDSLVVEGAGGLMSPLADDCFNADVAVALGARLVVVAPNRLGVINHVLQTLLVAERYRLPVTGVVLNQVDAEADASTATNAETIRRYGKLPWVAEVDHAGELPSLLAFPPGA